MRKIFYLMVITPLFSFGQISSDTLWGNKNFRFGLTLQTGIFFWNQSNLNNILIQNQVPTTKELITSIGIGDILQWNKFRLTGLIVFWNNAKSTSQEKMEQRFGGGELNGEYFIVREKGWSLSPILGGGIIFGGTKTRKPASIQSISNAFANRNTTELFNRQGFLHAGVNFGFAYSPRTKTHIYQLAPGFKYGFSNTDWSTDPKSEVLTNSTSDALRQFYLTLKTNFMAYAKNK
jgi:hypothetical protein